QVNHKLTGVRSWEEGEAQKREDQEARCERKAETSERCDRPSQNAGNNAVVEAEEVLKAVVKPDVEAFAETTLRARVFRRHLYFGRRSAVMCWSLGEASAEERHHRHGDRERSEQR